MMTAMKHTRTLAEKWMWLGVFAIAVAGLYSLVPVVARSPQLKSLGVMQNLFDVALVVHVDLSVLVWFFAMLCMGASVLMERVQAQWPYWGEVGFACCALATLLMTLSPLDDWVAIKSNYIPVLHNQTFLLALGLLLAGLIATLLPVLITYLHPSRCKLLNPIELGTVAASLVVMIGLAAYALGAKALPEGLELIEHYERLFWAGGHVMQFAFTILVMVAWLVLLDALRPYMPKRFWALLIYNLTVLAAVVSFAGFIIYDFDSGEFTMHQTRMMNEWGGVGATLMALMVISRLVRIVNSPPEGESKRLNVSVGGNEMTQNPPTDLQGQVLLPRVRGAKEKRAYASCLIVSLVLFFAGGALGLMIAGQNVTIPAHYHGMIVGITQALMGLAYVMLPRFGYHSVAHTRLAFWQPVIYGMGQVMHIGGLAYCGGYGILRKTAGGFENLAPDIKIALGIFGLGGLLAIIGGALFVVVMLRARRKASVSPQ